MMSQKTKEDLTRYLEIMTRRFRETVGEESFYAKASMEMLAYDIALKALSTPIIKADSISEMDLAKELNEQPGSFIHSEVSRHQSCHHTWGQDFATMGLVCSQCGIKVDARDVMRNCNKITGAF